jgi:hypothetical protein
MRPLQLLSFVAMRLCSPSVPSRQQLRKALDFSILRLHVVHSQLYIYIQITSRENLQRYHPYNPSASCRTLRSSLPSHTHAFASAAQSRRNAPV